MQQENGYEADREKTRALIDAATNAPEANRFAEEITAKNLGRAAASGIDPMDVVDWSLTVSNRYGQSLENSEFAALLGGDIVVRRFRGDNALVRYTATSSGLPLELAIFDRENGDPLFKCTFNVALEEGGRVSFTLDHLYHFQPGRWIDELKSVSEWINSHKDD